MRIGSVHFSELALVVFLGLGVQWAPLEAQEPEDLSVDIDLDGESERITCIKFAENEEEGTFYQIQIRDDDNALLWEGPELMDFNKPFVFGSWHHGCSFPEFAADIDGDGHVEIVSNTPASDVSPTLFQTFRWKAGRLHISDQGVLLERPQGSGNFPWSNTDEWKGTWIHAFESGAENGRVQVRLMSYDGGATARIGSALVTFNRKGFVIDRWIEPLVDASNDNGDPANNGPGAMLQNNAYHARLGRGDHFNSKGTRLKSVVDILRQDRSNYHDGNGDMDDGDDRYFEDFKSRSRMDNLEVVPVQQDRESLEKAILQGTPLVEVQVTSDSLLVKIIEP